MNIRRPLTFLVVAGVFVASVVALLLTRPAPEAHVQDVQPVRVLLGEVQRETLRPRVRETGRLQPAFSASLRFEVGGQLAQRRVEPGMRIGEGDLLLQLGDADLADRFREAEAQYELEKRTLERDRELLRLARRNKALQAAAVERLASLSKDSLSSRSQLDAATQQLLTLSAEEAKLEYAVATADARLRLKESARNMARRNLERTRLKAPFAGTVNDVLVQVGDYVAANKPVLTLVDTGRLDLHLEVRGEVAANLRLGMAVPVLAGEAQRPGEVVALQYDPDPATSTHEVRIRIEGAGLRPGMLGQAILPLGDRKDVVTVPDTAVLVLDGRNWAFRFLDGHVQRVPVVLGAQVGERRIVRQGLEDGDRIVTRDVAALSDGQRAIAAPAAPGG